MKRMVLFYPNLGLLTEAHFINPSGIKIVTLRFTNVLNTFRLSDYGLTVYTNTQCVFIKIIVYDVKISNLTIFTIQ